MSPQGTPPNYLYEFATEAYWQPKLLMAKKEKAWQRRLAEDAMFQKALAEKP